MAMSGVEHPEIIPKIRRRSVSIMASMPTNVLYVPSLQILFPKVVVPLEHTLFAGDPILGTKSDRILTPSSPSLLMTQAIPVRLVSNLT